MKQFMQKVATATAKELSRATKRPPKPTFTAAIVPGATVPVSGKHTVYTMRPQMLSQLSTSITNPLFGLFQTPVAQYNPVSEQLVKYNSVQLDNITQSNIVDKLYNKPTELNEDENILYNIALDILANVDNTQQINRDNLNETNVINTLMDPSYPLSDLNPDEKKIYDRIHSFSKHPILFIDQLINLCKKINSYEDKRKEYIEIIQTEINKINSDKEASFRRYYAIITSQLTNFSYAKVVSKIIEYLQTRQNSGLDYKYMSSYILADVLGGFIKIKEHSLIQNADNPIEINKRKTNFYKLTKDDIIRIIYRLIKTGVQTHVSAYPSNEGNTRAYGNPIQNTGGFKEENNIGHAFCAVSEQVCVTSTMHEFNPGYDVITEFGNFSLKSSEYKVMKRGSVYTKAGNMQFTITNTNISLGETTGMSDLNKNKKYIEISRKRKNAVTHYLFVLRQKVEGVTINSYLCIDSDAKYFELPDIDATVTDPVTGEITAAWTTTSASTTVVNNKVITRYNYRAQTEEMTFNLTPEEVQKYTFASIVISNSIKSLSDKDIVIQSQLFLLQNNDTIDNFMTQNNFASLKSTDEELKGGQSTQKTRKQRRN